MKVDAQLLTNLIKARYPAPAYVFLPQVANGTGRFKSRTADALVMGVWPSRGLELIGFEVKVYRSDWLSELRRPEKAHAVAQFCDKWFIVAPSTTVVKLEELPPAWGLLVMKSTGRSLAVARQPKDKEEVAPLTRSFLAALLRNALAEIIPRGEINDQLNAQWQSGFDAGKAQANQQQQFASRNAESLAASVKKFEEVSGIRIDSYNGQNIGEAVRRVRQYSQADHVRQLETLRRIAQELVDKADNGLRDYAAQPQRVVRRKR